MRQLFTQTARRNFTARSHAFLIIVFLGVIVGCKKPQDVAAAPPSGEHQSPTKAQAKLQTLKLFLGPKEIVAELAISPIQVETGMMHRTEMGENEGMLFVFAQPHRASFWMRNTKIPLSGAYIDSEGTILEIHDMKPLDETPIPAGTDQVRYVLEMKQGWFERNKIGVGTNIRTERGTFQKTFFK